jgi:hypothetical protein
MSGSQLEAALAASGARISSHSQEATRQPLSRQDAGTVQSLWRGVGVVEKADCRRPNLRELSTIAGLSFRQDANQPLYVARKRSPELFLENLLLFQLRYGY